jgi:hypothetical protein
MIGCLDRGIELRRSFTTTVTYQGKPLPRVSVEVIHNLEGGTQTLAELTGSDGIARFSNLPPGDYWIKANLLGISAADECFHIDASASRKAKKNVHYEWGDEADSVAQARGRLVDSQSGKGSHPLDNLIHRVIVPIPDARMELRDPLTGATYKSVSGPDGQFVFEHVPNGTYVLHIDDTKGAQDVALDATDLLIRVDDHAKRRALLISHRTPGGGSCDGTSLEIVGAQ